MAKLTRERVIEIVSSLEDWKISAILRTGATDAELLEAQTRLGEQDDLSEEMRHVLSGRVAEIYDILMAGENEFGEARNRG